MAVNNVEYTVPTRCYHQQIGHVVATRLIWYLHSSTIALGEILENSTGAPPTVAGWYDDPDDANFIRYSNGRNWTGKKVPKEQNLTFNTDKVYRPGGVTKRAEPAAPVEPEVKENYQPLTRRERRELEKAEHATKGVPIAVGNDLEFEFQTASTAPKSYVRSEEQSDTEAEQIVETPLPLPALEEAAAHEDNDPFIPAEDDFDFGSFPALDSVAEEPEEETTPSLPGLDFSGIGEPIEDDGSDDLPEEQEESVTPELPSLSFDAEDDAPAADAEDDFEWAAPKKAHYVPATEDNSDFFSEDDFVAADTDEHSSSDDDEVEIIIPPVVAEQPVRRSYERPQPVTAPVAKAKEEEPVKAPEAAAVVEEDDAPAGGFGFASKLNRWKGDATEEAAEAAPAAEEEVKESKTTALPAVVPAKEEEHESEPDSDEEDDENDEDEEYEEPRGIRGRFKSFFSRNKNDDDDVLEDDEDESDDEQVDESPESEDESPSKKQVVADSSEEEDEDDDTEDSDEEIPLEEPQLKAGLFSSRQEKEDAATELKLLGRLQEVANRVAALQKEESELKERIAKARQEEEEINARIVHAHEEHEVLDNLAKARRVEHQKENSRAEDEDLLNIIESHSLPNIPMDDLIEFEEDEEESKPKAAYDPDEDRSPKPTLPQLKF